jgi:cation diffusion facilitator family transporter
VNEGHRNAASPRSHRNIGWGTRVMVKAQLRYPIYLSIGAGVITLLLKMVAYYLTNSVGLLSDAAESLVNLLAALAAYFALRYAAKPVDRDHPYGHEKVEFFSSGLEGGLILVAALTIAWYAVRRLLWEEPLERLGSGLLFLLPTVLINAAVGIVLLRAGRKHHSIVLEADGRHKMVDVWTSIAIVVGLTLVMLTGVKWLDPVLALLVSAYILWTAAGLMWRSFQGLLDHALPAGDLAALRTAIEAHLDPQAAYHAVRTRRAGAVRFVEFHLLVPGSTTVRQAHALTHRIEDAVRAALPGAEVLIHIEPIEERASWEDSALVPLEQADRAAQPHVPN